MELGATRVIINAMADTIHQVVQVNGEEPFAKFFQTFKVFTVYFALVSDSVLKTNPGILSMYNNMITKGEQ